MIRVCKYHREKLWCPVMQLYCPDWIWSKKLTYTHAVGENLISKFQGCEKLEIKIWLICIKTNSQIVYFKRLTRTFLFFFNLRALILNDLILFGNFNRNIIQKNMIIVSKWDSFHSAYLIFFLPLNKG